MLSQRRALSPTLFGVGNAGLAADASAVLPTEGGGDRCCRR